MRARRAALAAVLAAVLAASAAAGAATAAADPAETPGSTAIPAASGTWREHQYTFQFMGFTSTYSCDGLADKLAVLLRAAGARGDLKSRPGVCASGFGRPDKFAQAFLTFHTLTPDAHDASASASAGVASVPGAWRAVALASRSPREIAVGDCELVEQFRTSVLPMFSTRGIDDHTTCVPHQESGSVINLKFEVFAAVKGAEAPAAPAPAAKQGRPQ